jgi:hypothetical protein
MREMADALLGTDADRDAFINLEALRHAVSRHMFCQWTSVILDVRTAVLVTLAKGDDRASWVVTGTAWDAVTKGFTQAATKNDMTVEAIDGRQLHARSKGRG